MVGIDGNGRDGGGRREDIPLTYSPSFHFYFSLFYFLLPFSLPLSFLLFFLYLFLFLFFKDTSKFQKNLHEIRIWRSCFMEV